MNVLPGASPTPPPWWQRLHGALMPDYNRSAAAVWWTAAVCGWLLLLWSMVHVATQGWLAVLQVTVGSALAVGAGLFPVRVPGTKNSYAAGEVFIFLLLMMLGPPAAAVAAACETGVGSLRTSKRWTSRIYGPAVAGLAMTAAGSLWQLSLHALVDWGLGGVAVELALTMTCSALYFLIAGTLMSGVLQLKRGEAFFQPAGLLSVFRWVGLAYAGSASLASLLFFTLQQQGLAALLVMLPLLVMLLVTLHYYFRQQEAAEKLRESSIEVAAREATLAAREAEATERHLRELQASERRFHSAFTHAGIGMALLSFDGHILQANLALAEALGHSVDELQGQRIDDHAAPDERDALRRRLGLTSAGEFQGFRGETKFQNASGDPVWLALHCSFFTEPDAAEPCLILQAQDVSARRSAEAGLAHMAFHDALTGLPNRRRFMEALSGAVSRSQADASRAWAVIFLDFDRFKIVNDSLGHGAGDELLKQLAQRLQERLRPSDMVARLGGDEFAILAERIEHERDAVVLAERLQDTLKKPFEVAGNTLTASASMGITFSAFGYDSAEAVLRDADTAMYKAKSQGKARFAVFDASLHAAVSERLRLEGDLRRAIAEGQLSVVYQPLFKLGAVGGAPPLLSGFEALVRWRQPGGDTLQPTSFLPIAEETGLMVQVSDFVLHCACRQLRQWQESSPELAGLNMSINLSAGDLSNPALVARISRAIVEAGLRPQDLTLEITEDILMSNMAGALEALQALRRLGVRLAVDDFGTGYSSLSHLSRLPIDSLKIDRSFVRQLKRDSDDAAVVAAIVQLGSTLRKAVVAEGIETADQMLQLRELGCELGQGFHLAQPLSETAAGEWLAARRQPLH